MSRRKTEETCLDCKFLRQQLVGKTLASGIRYICSAPSPAWALAADLDPVINPDKPWRYCAAWLPRHLPMEAPLAQSK